MAELFCRILQGLLELMQSLVPIQVSTEVREQYQIVSGIVTNRPNAEEPGPRH